MNIRFLGLLAGMVFAVELVAGQSDPLRICCSAEKNLIWQTIADNEVTLQFSWPKGAETARLTAVNLAGETVLSETLSAGTQSYVWQVFDGAVPVADDCFRVTVDYSSVKTESVDLVLERGTFSPVTVHVADSEKAFAKCGNVGRPLVYDADWLGDAAGNLTMTVAPRASGSPLALTPPTKGNGFCRWSVKENGQPDGWYDVTFGSADGSDSLAGPALIGTFGLLLVVY